MAQCEPALGVDLELEIDSLLDRLLINGSGGDLDVLLADGGHDVAGGEIPGCNPVRIQPDAHRVIAGTKDPDVAGPRNTCQDVLDLERRVIAQIDIIIAAVRREQMHDHGEVRRFLGGRDTQPADLLWQFRQRLRHAILDLHLRFVHVRAEVEGKRQSHHAIARGLGG